jgi:hypothetical protein
MEYMKGKHQTDILFTGCLLLVHQQTASKYCVMMTIDIFEGAVAWV